jgi:hypothetical protein
LNLYAVMPFSFQFFLPHKQWCCFLNIHFKNEIL